MNEIGVQENKIVFVNKVFFEEDNKYTVEAKKNALIYLNSENSYMENFEFSSLYNILKIYTSPNKNMKLVGITPPIESNDIILENYYNIPIYIEESEQNIDIKVQKFNSTYAILGVINNNLLQNYFIK